MRCAVLYSVLVLCLVSMPVLGGQAGNGEPMLEFHCVGLSSWPVSDSDQQMMDTVKLLRDRIADLVEELDLDPHQGQAMIAGWDIFAAGWALRLDADEDGVVASLVLKPGDAELDGLYAQVISIAEMAGLGMEELSPTSSELIGPMGPVGLGHDDELLWLNMGQGENVSTDIPRGDLPRGVTPLMGGRMDIGGLVNYFAPDLVETNNQESSMVWNSMNAFLGEDAPVIEFNVGTSDDQMHMTSRMIGAARNSEAMGMSTDVFFEKSEFKRVPKDAVRVVALQTNISTMLSAIEAALEEAGSDEYAEFTEELGVDLVQDILGNLGDKMMFYQAESTGGGGLLSAVLLVELNDARGFGDAHEVLVDRLNMLAAEEINGYARVQSWRSGGGDLFSITTPGLPIPLEPSWAIDGTTLIVALSPGALERAVLQVQLRASGSIVDNRLFSRSVLSRMPDGKAYSVSYYDAARLSKKGYGLTTMLMSALSNATRSPKNPDRVVGSIMPDFVSFTKDIEPSGTVSWWDGDDFRTHYIGDESMLVQLSTGFGAIADVQGLVVPALGAGVLLPALGKARERANELKASTQVRTILQGMIIYTGNNNDRFPESIEEMVDLGYIEAELLESPFGPAFDGGADFAIRSDDIASNNLFNSRFIIAVDRAMWVNWEDMVAVGFADAHVELLTRHELQELLDLPLNKGAAEILKLPDF